MNYWTGYLRRSRTRFRALSMDLGEVPEYFPRSPALRKAGSFDGFPAASAALFAVSPFEFTTSQAASTVLSIGLILGRPLGAAPKNLSIQLAMSLSHDRWRPAQMCLAISSGCLRTRALDSSSSGGLMNLPSAKRSLYGSTFRGFFDLEYLRRRALRLIQSDSVVASFSVNGELEATRNARATAIGSSNSIAAISFSLRDRGTNVSIKNEREGICPFVQRASLFREPGVLIVDPAGDVASGVVEYGANVFSRYSYAREPCRDRTAKVMRGRRRCFPILRSRSYHSGCQAAHCNG